MAEPAPQKIQTGGDELARLRDRSEKAFTNCAGHNGLVEEVYRYVLPMRKPATDGNQGQRRFSEIFDSTAPRAAWRFAGRLQSELTPPFQTFFELKVGPAMAVEGDAKKATNEDLGKVSLVVRSQIAGSNFDVASHEGYFDLFAGDMALLMLETGDKSNPTHYVAVPSTEVAIRRDGFGRRAGIYWKRKFLYGDLPTLWKSLAVSKETQKKIDEAPDTECEIVQSGEYDAPRKQWKFRAFFTAGGGQTADGEQGILYSDDAPYCCWLTPSFWQVPGEAKGRGPGMAGLGAAKVANKVQEFALKNAAFATLGLWMYRDDGGFRIANAPIVPGAFWKVASTGGPFGPSISKLPMADKFDVSMFVLQELQMQIKQTMLDDTLPPDAGPVRSATEIVERMKRLAADWSGAYSRLQRDFIRPLVEWNIWIASKNGTLPASFKIDEQLLRLEIVSPVARGDQASAVENEVKWIQLMASLFGPEMVMLLARVEDIGRGWGTKLGVDEKLIRSDAEKKALQDAMAKILLAQQQAAQQPANAAGQTGAEASGATAAPAIAA